jgi:hypothetical protein
LRIDNANSEEIQGKVEKHSTWSAARAYETLATGRKKIKSLKRKINKRVPHGPMETLATGRKKVKSLKKTWTWALTLEGLDTERAALHASNFAALEARLAHVSVCISVKRDLIHSQKRPTTYLMPAMLPL